VDHRRENRLSVFGWQCGKGRAGQATVVAADQFALVVNGIDLVDNMKPGGLAAKKVHEFASIMQPLSARRSLDRIADRRASVPARRSRTTITRSGQVPPLWCFLRCRDFAPCCAARTDMLRNRAI
jgi:hypothetical protein